MSTAIFNSDYEAADDILAPQIPIIRGVIARAIAEERERSAKIAERFNAAGKPIAEAIRRRI